MSLSEKVEFLSQQNQQLLIAIAQERDEVAGGIQLVADANAQLAAKVQELLVKVDSQDAGVAEATAAIDAQILAVEAAIAAVRGIYEAPKPAPIEPNEPVVAEPVA